MRQAGLVECIIAVVFRASLERVTDVLVVNLWSRTRRQGRRGSYVSGGIKMHISVCRGLSAGFGRWYRNNKSQAARLDEEMYSTYVHTMYIMAGLHHNSSSSFSAAAQPHLVSTTRGL